MKTKLLTILAGLLIIGCEPIEVEPIAIEKTFTVKCYASEQTGLTLSFPLLDESATNPIILSNMVNPSEIVIEVISESPFVIKAIARKKNTTVFIELYENNTLLLKDSLYAQTLFPELWVTYEFD